MDIFTPVGARTGLCVYGRWRQEKLTASGVVAVSETLFSPIPNPFALAPPNASTLYPWVHYFPTYVYIQIILLTDCADVRSHAPRVDVRQSTKQFVYLKIIFKVW